MFSPPHFDRSTMEDQIDYVLEKFRPIHTRSRLCVPWTHSRGRLVKSAFALQGQLRRSIDYLLRNKTPCIIRDPLHMRRWFAVELTNSIAVFYRTLTAVVDGLVPIVEAILDTSYDSYLKYRSRSFSYSLTILRRIFTSLLTNPSIERTQN